MKGIKSIIGSILIVGIMFVFVGCSSKDESSDNKEATSSEESENVISLPEGYPKEFVPIMEDTLSAEGLGGEEDFSIYYTTPSTSDEVVSFYEKYFEKYGESLVIAEDRKEINLEAESKKVNITIDNIEKNTTVRIKITKIKTAEETTIEEDENTVVIDFPTNIVPIITGGNIVDQNNKKIDEGTEYSVTILVDRSYDDTTAYYNTIASEDSEASINKGDSEFQAKYVKDKNTIEILIAKNSDTDTSVTINISPIK